LQKPFTDALYEHNQTLGSITLSTEWSYCWFYVHLKVGTLTKNKQEKTGKCFP